MLFGRKNYNSSKIEIQVMKILTIIKKKTNLLYLFLKKSVQNDFTEYESEIVKK